MAALAQRPSSYCGPGLPGKGPELAGVRLSRGGSHASTWAAVSGTNLTTRFCLSSVRHTTFKGSVFFQAPSQESVFQSHPDVRLWGPTFSPAYQRGVCAPCSECQLLILLGTARGSPPTRLGYTLAPHRFLSTQAAGEW